MKLFTAIPLGSVTPADSEPEMHQSLWMSASKRPGRSREVVGQLHSIAASGSRCCAL